MVVQWFPENFYISLRIKFITRTCDPQGFPVLDNVLHHVFDISTWGLNSLSEQERLRQTIMRLCLYRTFMASIAASCNKSGYLSSSSACPPVLEVLCIDGKPSDTPSSIDPGKREKEHSSYGSSLLNFWVHNNDDVRLIQLFPLWASEHYLMSPGGTAAAKLDSLFIIFFGNIQRNLFHIIHINT